MADDGDGIQPGYFIIADLICYCFCLFVWSWSDSRKARVALQPATRGRRRRLGLTFAGTHEYKEVNLQILTVLNMFDTFNLKLYNGDGSDATPVVGVFLIPQSSSSAKMRTQFDRTHTRRLTAGAALCIRQVLVTTAERHLLYKSCSRHFGSKSGFVWQPHVGTQERSCPPQADRQPAYSAAL